MDPLDLLLLTSQAPWWLGWTLIAGGMFALGLIVGMRLR